MKVVMLTRHACVRVMKQALPLIARGYEVHLITNKVTQFSELCRSVTVYQDVDQLYDAVKLHRDADIFHAHNEPSWFVTVVKDALKDKPVILDVHDSHLLRRRPEEIRADPELWRVSVDERNNMQLADGLVYVCEPMERIVGGEFGLDQPSTVLPSYLPRRFYRIDFDRWLGGLVYEGRIDLPDELDKKWNFFQYANYLDLAREAREIGMDFHVYTPRENARVRKVYGEACYLHDPVRMDRLVKCLGSHDWGLVGNSTPFEEWKHALPNKLFEYMAGCTPVVAMHAEESARVIEEHGVGIVVGSVAELAERWAEHRECRKNVIKHRDAYVMENHIHRVEKLYREFATNGTVQVTWEPEPASEGVLP